MKKILLIIAITFCIFQMVVLAVDIDVGSPAINRNNTAGAVFTIVDKNNPAEDAGIITSIEIWANSQIANCEVATFFVVSGNNLSTRDSVTLGTITAGSKQTFTEDSESNPIAIEIEAGDYIGFHGTAGTIERTTGSADAGVWMSSGLSDYIPCENQVFDSYTGQALSLYGIGTDVTGWPHEWNTKEISKWNNKEFTKWNGLE